MFTFLRANIASLIASLMDYAIMVCLVELLQVNPVIAGITGTFCGGVINFFIGRGWVFKSLENKMSRQAVRYLIVWAGNLLLNAGGMYLLVEIAGLHYTIGKVIVSLLVAFAYNYPLQKRYVFYNNQ